MPQLQSLPLLGCLLVSLLWFGMCDAHADGQTGINASDDSELAAYRARTVREQAHKDIIHRWLSELWDQGNYSIAAELLTADFKRHSESEGYAAESPEAYAAIVKSCHDGFPDTRITLVDMIAEDDKVFVRWHWTGTHTSEFRGIPATGKEISVYGEDLIHFRDGKISAIWPLFDPLRLMLQIGAVEQITPP